MYTSFDRNPSTPSNHKDHLQGMERPKTTGRVRRMKEVLQALVMEVQTKEYLARVESNLKWVTFIQLVNDRT